MKFLIIAILFHGTTLFSNTLPPESAYQTVKWVLKTTEQYSDVLKAERQRVAAVKEQYHQANSFTRPRLSLDGSIGHNQLDTDNTTNTLEPRTVGLIAEQPLYRGGRTVASKRKATADIAQAEAFYQALRQDVFLQAIEAHARVLQRQAALLLFQQNQQALEKNLEATNTRFEYKQITRTDVAQAKSRLSQAKADTIQAKGDLTQAEAAFLEVVGVKPEKIQEITLSSPLPADLETAKILTHNQNLFLKAAKEAIEAAQYDVKQERGSLLPEISLVGGARYDRETNAVIRQQDSLDITARLSLPLYQGGLLRSRIRAANATFQSRQHDKNAIKRRIDREIVNAWIRSEVADARLNSLQNAVDSAQIALDSLQEESLAGTRTIVDLLNAEQEFLATQITLLESQTEKTVAEYAVLNQLAKIEY